MAVHDRIRKLTYDDYARIPDDGLRHEIIDGEHCVSPAPSTPHQRISRRLTLRLGGIVEKLGLGERPGGPGPDRRDPLRGDSPPRRDRQARSL
jgi:Uma2 family endonuclease